MRNERSPETQAKYDHDIKNELVKGLHNEPVIWQLGRNWRLIFNAYPYDHEDRGYDECMLVVFDKAISEKDMSIDDRLDRDRIIEEARAIGWDVKLNGVKSLSVKNIPHFHLLRRTR